MEQSLFLDLLPLSLSLGFFISSLGYNKDFTVAPKMNQDGRALGIAQKIKDVKLKKVREIPDVIVKEKIKIK